MRASLGDRARAVSEQIAALERAADLRMRLEALKLVERRQIGILIIEVHDKADRHQIIVEVVEERSAAGRIVERPAERMLHQALAMLARRDLPELLQTDAEFCRLAALIELKLLDQLFGEAA